MPEYRSSCQSWYKKIALLDNKEHSAEKHVPDNSACTPLQDRLADASTEFDVGQQHLSLSVPQIYVGRMARGIRWVEFDVRLRHTALEDRSTL